MTEKENMIKEISQYFEYIKGVYLMTFDKVLSEDVKQKIKNITTEILEIDEESEFQIKTINKIKFCLNIDEFIKNNNFENENFNDIDESGLRKINYYIENKNNCLKIAKDCLLENILLYFMDNKILDVLTLGTVNLLAYNISKKHNLKTLGNYEKEKEIVKSIIKITGEKAFFEAVLNDNRDIIKNIYNKYVTNIEEDNFDNLIKELNDIYSNYGKNKDKVYYADSLYYYQKINYKKQLDQINKVAQTKQNMINISYERLESIIDCIKELDRYKILYTNEEKVSLYYASINLKRIVNKLNEDQNIDKYFEEALKIENELRPLASKVWNYYLNSNDYDEEHQNWFLIETLEKGYKENNNRFVITNLITNDNIKISNNDSRYQYGFIYSIKEKAVVYASYDNILYKEYSKTNDYKDNINTIINEDEILEIEELKHSYLMSPRNLIVKTIKNNKKYNEVLIDKKYAKRIGILCIVNNTEDDICYNKAKDLADKHELPLIPIITSNESN
ncbi:MAG: hypothetical protein PHN42_01030 [Bacilli bacterium]|nr:hypothetical protein [Bacilli bacterium]